MQDPLFLIAVLPDEKIQREVTAFKQDCSRLFQASHALKSPPHITLIPPFGWRFDHLDKLANALSSFAAKQTIFEIGLQNFNCFQPRVIFIDILPNPLLVTLQAALEKHLLETVGLKPKRPDQVFHPHLTIAHRDLKRSIFTEAWEHFSKLDYRRKFPVEGLTLLRHMEKKWVTEDNYFFGQ